VKRLATLTLATLILPGSGHLWLDGLPFSKPVELVAASLVLILTTARPSRELLQNLSESRPTIAGFARWVLALACVAKVFTFFWMPFGNGFEACYRSIYSPVEPSYYCEKSYELWWGTPRSSLGTANISRVEDHINFGPSGGWPSARGASDSNWDLPFVNDFPRFGDLWLDRIPFTASFFTVLESDATTFLPVHGSGEFSVTVAGVSDSSESATAYAHDQTVVVPVPRGRSELRIDYRHADTLETKIPEVAPPPKGLSARLFVGRPMTRRELREMVYVRLRLVIFDEQRRTTPDKVRLGTPDGSFAVEAAASDRPDVAAAFNQQKYLRSGFDFEFPLKDLPAQSSLLEMTAVFRGVSTPVGRVSIDQSDNGGSGVRTISATSRWSTPQLSGWLTTDTARIEPLRPLGNTPAAATLFFPLTMMLNAVLLLPLLVAAFLLIRTVRSSLFEGLVALIIASLLAQLFWGTHLFDSSSPTLWILMLVLALTALFRSRVARPTLFAAAIFASIRIIVSLTEKFNSIPADAWWGRIIFMSRDSDWFVGQGYARQILNDGSLRAGESLFYFQPGVRYLVFLSHLVFGENDVFIAIVLMTALLFAVCWLLQYLYRSPVSVFTKILGITAGVFVVNAVLSQSIATFAIAFASEYPTWILLTCAVILTSYAATSNSVSAVLGASAIAALLPNFRPNQIGGSIMLLLITASTSWRIEGLRITQRLSGVLKVLSVYVSIALLSLAHNLHYGETFTLYSTTGNLNADFSWASLFTSGSARESLELVWNKVRLGLYWTNWPTLDDLSLSFWGSQLVWLVCLIWLTSQRRLSTQSSMYLLLPFAYLIPLLPYRFDSYYPRHVVVIQFAFAIGAVAALMSSRRSTTTDRLS